MTQGTPGDEIVRRLVALARAQRADVSFRERKFLERFDELMGQRRAARSRSKRRTFAGVTLLAACSLLAAIALWVRAPAALSYELAGAIVAGEFIEGQSGARVDFSDGSRLSLAKGARVSVSDLTAHGSRVDLEQGQASLNVVKSGQTAWLVQAGPYAVRVTGTAFDVRWSKQERRFELDLHHGSVVIEGPGIEGAIGLEAGQKFVGAPNAPVKVERARPAVAELAKPIAAAQPSGTSGPIAAPERATPVAPMPNSAEPTRELEEPITWTRLVAQGKFQQVIDAARSQGMAEVLSGASLADLAALADAARYARSSELARQALLGVRRRFPNARRARDAAFFLGGLEERDPKTALEWYERYLAESAGGPYTSQALGRRLMLVYQLRGAEGATPLAKQYLERFSNGPYASAARKILDRQSP